MAGGSISLFLPDAVASDPKFDRGIFFGRSVAYGTITYATIAAFLPLPYSGKQLRKRTQLISTASKLQVIGALSSDPSDSPMDAPTGREAEVFFRLLKSKGHELKCDPASSSCKGNPVQCHIITFSPEDVLSSELLVEHSSDTISSFSFIGLISESYAFNLPLELEKRVIRFYEPAHTDSSIDEKGDDFCSEIGHSLFWKIACLTTTGALLCFRVQQVKFVARTWRSKRSQSVKIGNILFAIAIDILIGIVFTKLLFRNPDPRSWLSVSVSFAETVINRLESLLNTLIEMPAGLKLNRPLNTALGQFFLYHIYLLRTYMSIVKPVYMGIAGFVSLFGMFGLTCMLSIICDLFSLATIHIFCFYGYAARLYSFQTGSLSALWRLFRGKKWNQLKCRVDSYSYQYDQLFMGSICFTIVVFLLPTVLLYYGVFLLLRLATMMFLLVLRVLISKLCIIPAYAFVLVLISSRKLVSGVFFDAKSGIRMKTSMISFGQLFDTNPRWLTNPLSSQRFDLGQVLSMIAWGDLLSPF